MLLIYLIYLYLGWSYLFLFILLFTKFIAKTFLNHETSVYTRPESTIIRVARMNDGGFPCTVETVMELCALALVAPRKGRPSINSHHAQHQHLRMARKHY